METLEVPQGSFALDRHPTLPGRPLRAWDAADEYLALDLARRPHPPDPDRTLIVNDSSGALTVALGSWSGRPPLQLTDSHLSVIATRANLERNGLDPEGLRVLAGPDALVAPDRRNPTSGVPADEPARFSLVVIKVPKSLGLLEDQLHRIRTVVDNRTQVVAGAMSRHLHRSTLELFERVLGTARTTLARKKARLILCTPDHGRRPARSPWPKQYALPDGNTAVNHAGVHAAGRLDPGTRLFLSLLPTEPVGGRIIDLGCGDGAVGVTAASLHPAAEVTFIDESYLAVASAEATYRLSASADRPARFLVGDGVDRLPPGQEIEPGSVDLVLVNPPFHADHAIGDDTAWRMFHGARRVLRPGGEIRVVGNRHLSHHAKLTRLFGGHEVIGSDARFVVVRAVRR
jgi:23S rRNA (guanine1835-N2)-methyltransferase